MKKHTQTLYCLDVDSQNVIRSLMLFLVVASMVIIQTYPVFAVDPLDRTSVEHPRLVNAFGSPIGTKISVNQQVQIMSDVRNNQNESQQFIYIVQVKDSTQRIVSLGWFSGNLNPNQVFSPALSWTPQFVGEYTAEIFVWDNFNKQSPLDESKTIEITVS